MVRPGSVAADIGTDHAYLPAALILNGICPRALACDLRKGPLSNAAKTVHSYGLEGKITLRLSDGFDELEPFEADDFILCGMGGTLMAELVSRAYWLKDPAKRLILQPQSHAEDIRSWLIHNGFCILREDACIDSGKLYCAIAAEYTGESREFSAAYPYTGELPKCGKPEARDYLIKVKERLIKKQEAQLDFGSADEAARLKEIIDETETLINEMQSDG